MQNMLQFSQKQFFFSLFLFILAIHTRSREYNLTLWIWISPFEYVISIFCYVFILLFVVVYSSPPLSLCRWWFFFRFLHRLVLLNYKYFSFFSLSCFTSPIFFILLFTPSMIMIMLVMANSKTKKKKKCSIVRWF